MTTIYLGEFLNYNMMMMEDFLKLEKTGNYQIIITSVFAEWVSNDDYCILYMILAYTGHLLSRVSQEFSYDIPCCYESRPFCFRIHSRDCKELASVLYKTCQVLFGIPGKYNRFILNAKDHYHRSAGLEFCAGAAGYFQVPFTLRCKTIQKTERRKDCGNKLK